MWWRIGAATNKLCCANGFALAVVRKVHSSGMVYSKAKASVSGSSRQVKIMNKLLFGKTKGKRGWYNTPSESTLNQFSSVKSISNPLGVQKHTNRRITVLNKLFMKNITDLMATGAMAESITGLGIEVSRVLVAPDFMTINVYWLAKGSEDDQEIETLLRKCSGHLRHELSQLRVMGEVPRIHFVKDLEFAKFVEVERILKGADMGDENEELVNENGETSPHGLHNNNSLPEMRHDVLGLNHSAILSRIQEKLKVSKVAWDQFKSSSKMSETETADKNTLEDAWETKRLQTLEREERFAEFLKNKRQSKMKNAVNRADREFLVAENRNTMNQEDYVDLEEEYDVFDEELHLKDERRDQ